MQDPNPFLNSLVSPQLPAWARQSVLRMAKSDRTAPLPVRKRKPFIIHLDGVPRTLLEDAVQTGRMPFFSRLVRSGAYHLDPAFWGSPASTPCFQAGLLYGIRHPNLPAYKWFDRELGRKVQMNTPGDALAVEQRLSRRDGNSLLSGGGTSYLSLFRAGASNLLSMSCLADLKRFSRSLRQDLRGIRSASHRSLGAYFKAMLQETCRAAWDSLRWVLKVEDGRHERAFFFNRVALTSLAWSFAHSRAMIDMVRGVPSVYLVYGNYDEVAHRRGPRSAQALRELYRVDSSLEELFAVNQALPQPYDIYFVTDHGHVDSAPFERRSGKPLEARLLEGDAPGLPQSLQAALLDGRAALEPSPGPCPEEPVLVDAGNFAHIYLGAGKRPLEAREVLARHPELLSRLMLQKDIALIALRRGEGAVAIIQGQMYGPDEVERAPLASGFSRRAVADLLRELPYMSTAGDLVLYGQALEDGSTVGFAWEFGSHGGLTRTETDSVVCWPAHAPVSLSGLNHCIELNRRLSEAYRS